MGNTFTPAPSIPVHERKPRPPTSRLKNGLRAFTACVAFSLPLASCIQKEPSSTSERAVQGKSAKPGDRLLKRAEAHLNELGKQSKGPKVNNAGIAKAEAGMGSIVAEAEPEELLKLYRSLDAKIRGMDQRMKNGGTSLIQVTAAGISHAKESSSGISENERLGALFLMLPLLPGMLQPKSAVDVLSKSKDTSVLMECMEDLKQDGKSKHMVGRVREWAEGRNPPSDESLLFLFATMK